MFHPDFQSSPGRKQARAVLLYRDFRVIQGNEVCPKVSSLIDPPVSGLNFVISFISTENFVLGVRCTNEKENLKHHAAIFLIGAGGR